MSDYHIPRDHGLTAEYLETLYSLRGGELYYKPRPIRMFTGGRRHERDHKRWNTIYADNAVCPNASKYKMTRVPLPDGGTARVKVHNIVECMETGEWPTEQTDHKNGDTLDNRPCNLRPATNSQQSMNRGRLRNNTSGVTGVYYHRRDRKWEASIMKDGTTIQLYWGDSKQDAVVARKAGELRYFGEYRRRKS